MYGQVDRWICEVSGFLEELTFIHGWRVLHLGRVRIKTYKIRGNKQAICSYIFKLSGYQATRLNFLFLESRAADPLVLQIT